MLRGPFIFGFWSNPETKFVCADLLSPSNLIYLIWSDWRENNSNHVDEVVYPFFSLDEAVIFFHLAFD